MDIVNANILGEEFPDGGQYPTPDRSGAVRIVGAQGMRLILASTSGETYYFDVPGEQFTTSLSDIVPTATTWPPLPLAEFNTDSKWRCAS